MKLDVLAAAGVALSLAAMVSVPPPLVGQTGPDGSHAYFDALVARPDYWKSFSLRDQAQLVAYRHSNILPPAINYDPLTDAARVLIPSFVDIDGIRLAAPVGPNDKTITVVGWASGDVGISFRIEDEVILQPSGYLDRSERVRTVVRGHLGTIPSAHPAGTVVETSVNSVVNQVRLPLGTVTGHTYLLTWDALWTDSFLPSRTGLTEMKTFQFGSPSGDPRWLETRTRFDGDAPTGRISFDPTRHIAAIDVRTYSDRLGPGVTEYQPLRPQAGAFLVKPNTWTRFWWLVDQRGPDWDVVTLWVGDETTNPIRVIDALPLHLPEPTRSISLFWLEFDTSTERLSKREDMVAYVRNLVVLQNPGAVSPLLIRP